MDRIGFVKNTRSIYCISTCILFHFPKHENAFAQISSCVLINWNSDCRFILKCKQHFPYHSFAFSSKEDHSLNLIASVRKNSKCRWLNNQALNYPLAKKNNNIILEFCSKIPKLVCRCVGVQGLGHGTQSTTAKSGGSTNEMEFLFGAIALGSCDDVDGAH